MGKIYVRDAEKGSAVIPVVIIVCFLLAIAGYVAFTKLSTKPATSSQPTSSYATPTMPVTDFAPNLPMSQKTTLLIRDADSSTKQYIVPTDQVDTYVKQLPAGESVVSKTHN
jgi:hypothetical protein